jgi:glycolate oxidase FAD binding subunit
MAQQVEPQTFEEAAGALAGAAAAHQSVRIWGAGTKLGWGAVTPAPELELRSTGLTEVLEHNAGDLTAILEAGVPLARAQEMFARVGQMLALDPALGLGGDRSATIGGVIAAGDSGPLRHRYGAPRDLVLGMTVALSDGTIARSGGKVIKNVAGYDLAKLFAGSFGTLGMILSVSVRLHPLPAGTATVLGATGDPAVLQAAARTMSRAPLELEALDVAWRAGRGGIIARCGGTEPGKRATRAAALLRTAGLEGVDLAGDEERLWSRQRAGQRARDDFALVRVAGRPSALTDVIALTQRCGGTLVGRAALGTSYIEVEPDAVAALRAGLPRGVVSVLLDAPEWLRADVEVWGASRGPELELMRRIKQRFDPARACNPGAFVGGI